MISVSEALALVDQHTQTLSVEMIPLDLAMGSTLGADIYAPISLPSFRQSSMDGYAFIHGGQTELMLIGESKAGDFQNFLIQKGEAIRIYTGALVPDQADTVVMQEHVEKTDSGVRILKMPPKNSNVRAIGEQIQAGDLALKAGTRINVPIIGFLGGFGLKEIPVIRKPSISILVTGNEIQSRQEQLEAGKIFESNSLMLKLALESMGVVVKQVLTASDNQEETRNAIETGLNSDVLIISGGISVGDYDFVKEALEKNEVKEVFYKVNQKPGKPFWFGKKDQKYVFALPGNPASTLMCFLVYVAPAIQKMHSGMPIGLSLQQGNLATTIQNNFGKTLFLLAKEENGSIELLPKQASSMLISFSMSNAILVFPAELEELKAGEIIRYFPINRS
ncbi:MAG: molybdopterin molybdotransferase [Algoriphagus sp.]|jgi:molybdopterin molybdotransferase